MAGVCSLMETTPGLKPSPRHQKKDRPVFYSFFHIRQSSSTTFWLTALVYLLVNTSCAGILHNMKGERMYRQRYLTFGIPESLPSLALSLEDQ